MLANVGSHRSRLCTHALITPKFSTSSGVGCGPDTLRPEVWTPLIGWRNIVALRLNAVLSTLCIVKRLLLFGLNPSKRRTLPHGHERRTCVSSPHFSVTFSPKNGVVSGCVICREPLVSFLSRNFTLFFLSSYTRIVSPLTPRVWCNL